MFRVVLTTTMVQKIVSMLVYKMITDNLVCYCENVEKNINQKRKVAKKKISTKLWIV